MTDDDCEMLRLPRGYDLYNYIQLYDSAFGVIDFKS